MSQHMTPASGGQLPPQYTGTPSTPAQTYQPYNADAIGAQHTGSSSYNGVISPQDSGPSPPQQHQGYYAPQSQPKTSYEQLQPQAQAQAQAYEMETPEQHNQPYQAQSQQAYPMQNQPQSQPPTQYPTQQPMKSQPQQAHNPDNSKYAQSSTQQQGGGQQPPGYSQHRTTVPIANLSAVSAPVDCPNCHQRTLTRTRFESGNTTNAWAAGLCICLCLGCIPYCMDSTKDVVHNCGNCGVNLATWRRSGRTDVHLHA